MVPVFGGIPERTISNPNKRKPRYRILISGVFLRISYEEKKIGRSKVIWGTLLLFLSIFSDTHKDWYMSVYHPLLITRILLLLFFLGSQRMTILLDSIQISLRDRTQTMMFIDIRSSIRIKSFGTCHQCFCS